MALAPLFISFVLALALRHQSSASAANSNQCYKRDGTPQAADKSWLPCDPSAKASHCCSAYDLCMSNGLCLDTISDQWFSAQGCSDSRWPEDSCRELCNATIRDSDGYSRVWICEHADKAGSVRYCCGANTCCQTESNLQAIHVATAAFHPPQADSATSSASAPTSASLAPAPTPTQSARNDGANSGSHDDNSRALPIGLGVGISLGLALIGGVIFLGFQLRKWAAATQESTADNKKGGEQAASGVGVFPTMTQQTYPSELANHERRRELNSDGVEIG